HALPLRPRGGGAALARGEVPGAGPARAPPPPPPVGRLPLTDASVAVIAAIDMLLFPAETARVLAPDGVLLWINQLGCDGPLYLPAATVVAALPGTWQATESEAGWGSWAALRRTR
ncbi:hypothetical protein ACGFZ9_48505, partial [Streptomyces mirabilis]|uniref:hypothetical protein n=1 Tax=Streptomyces mirabilis TaxID=68239 RepID=UPI003724250E